MDKLPQIIKRKIGAVDIIDLRGQFVGPWALRGREEISQFIKSHQTRNLLINLRGLETLDSLGVKAVTENFQPGVRNAMVVGNSSVMEMFSRVAPVPTGVKLFSNEEEIIHYFGEDLVKWDESTFDEKRKHLRIKTALPLEFSCQDEAGNSLFFRAIVTDLSAGGLYAEYLDLDDASLGGFNPNPYDFRMLDLKIKLPGSREFVAKGKVARTLVKDEQMGFGIEFYTVSEEDRKLLTEFLQ